jgi:transaldolase
MNPLTALAQAGVAVWLDDLSRDRITSGNLAELIGRGVVGVTTNPTIFAGAVAHGDGYAPQLAELAAAGTGVEDAVATITADDVRAAADVLRATYDLSGTIDGRVSLEVDPRLARDTAGTIAQAEQLWARVDRPNLFIKIPATVEGLPAITAALAQGISVNVTLIFSLERYRAVLDAFAAGLEQARAAGLDLGPIGSVASFFVSRVDTAVDARLDAIGSTDATALRGRAAIANARLAYGEYLRWKSSPAWQSLAGSGAHPQRPLWASTGVKDPAYSDTRYVDELVAAETVNTMPAKTLEAVADHGQVTGDTVTGAQVQSAQAIAGLAAVGVDLDEVTDQLETEGIDKFEASWAELLETVGRRLKTVG